MQQQQGQEQTQGQEPRDDRYNSIASSAWAHAQELRAHGRGERLYGLFEAICSIETQRRRHQRRHLQTGAAYDFAAVAVLDDVLSTLRAMEERLKAAYEYELWVYQQEVERVRTRVLPVVASGSESV